MRRKLTKKEKEKKRKKTIDFHTSIKVVDVNVALS